MMLRAIIMQGLEQHGVLTMEFFKEVAECLHEENESCENPLTSVTNAMWQAALDAVGVEKLAPPHLRA